MSGWAVAKMHQKSVSQIRSTYGARETLIGGLICIPCFLIAVFGHINFLRERQMAPIRLAEEQAAMVVETNTVPNPYEAEEYQFWFEK